jgi:glyoxylase-like metal-dependent hydrolase (beta-lactamase superfamily II)
MINQRTLGDGVELYQVIEFHGPTHDAQWMLPGLTPESVQANLAWLSPDYYMPRTNRLVFTFQLWVLHTPEGWVIVDTGTGNGKTRVAPSQHMLNTPVIDWLKAIGAEPNEVKHVIHTHLHGDHVGWNTQFVDGRWEPTFPNAQHYIPIGDWQSYSERHEARTLPQVFDAPFEDSVMPIVAAGLHRFVKAGDEVAGFTAIDAPGHTPGTLVWSLEAGGHEYLFSGDVIHSPIQILYPQINSRWCELQDEARSSRLALLARAARDEATIMPAHAKRMEGWRVSRRAEGFAIDIQHS